MSSVEISQNCKSTGWREKSKPERKQYKWPVINGEKFQEQLDTEAVGRRTERESHFIHNKLSKDDKGRKQGGLQTASTTPIFSAAPSVSAPRRCQGCSALLRTAAAAKCPDNFRVLVCAWAWVRSCSAFICRRWYMRSPTCCAFPDSVPGEAIRAATQLWDEKEGSQNRWETAKLSGALAIVSSLFSAWDGADLQNKPRNTFDWETPAYSSIFVQRRESNTAKLANNAKQYCYSKTEKNCFRSTDCATCLEQGSSLLVGKGTLCIAGE